MNACGLCSEVTGSTPSPTGVASSASACAWPCWGPPCWTSAARPRPPCRASPWSSSASSSASSWAARLGASSASRKLSVCLSVSFSVSLSVCLPVCQCLFSSLSLYLYLSVCMSVFLSVCLSRSAFLSLLVYALSHKFSATLQFLL